MESGNVSENWSQWRELIELVFAGPDADKWSDQQKAAHFLICVGQKGRDVCRAWQASGEITAEDKRKTEVLFAKFKAYCNPRRNSRVQRKLFYERKQCGGVRSPVYR